MATEQGTVIAAGASARAEFDRRLARHQERARRRRPRLLTIASAGVVVALWALATNQPPIIVIVAIGAAISAIGGILAVPTHVTAWAIGAEGEGRTAAALEPLTAEGFRILHDLPIPRSRANIDHVVIGPPGVFVIETKSFKGKLEIRGQDVFVAGRRKTAMLDEVRREVAVVDSILADDVTRLGIIVKPLICVHHADLPLFQSTAQGIPILSAKGVVRELRKAPTALGGADVERLADRLAQMPRRGTAVATSGLSSPEAAAPLTPAPRWASTVLAAFFWTAFSFVLVLAAPGMSLSIPCMGMIERTATCEMTQAWVNSITAQPWQLAIVVVVVAGYVAIAAIAARRQWRDRHGWAA